MEPLSPGDCAISSIASFELFTGVEKCANPASEEQKVDLLLATVTEIAFDHLASRESARIRAILESQGCMIGPYDILIAGHALSIGLILVSGNTSEFSRVPGLQLENWM